MLKIAVCGALGRMGARVVAAIIEDPDAELAGAVEAVGHAKMDKDVGTVLGYGPHGMRVTDDLEKVIAGADCVIDFTDAPSSLAFARVAAAAQTPIVIGSTGFDRKQAGEIKKLARRIPIVLAPNMSVGVNVMFRLAADLARHMGDGYDVEIIEVHHNQKTDAPSGTALRLGQIVAAALGRDFRKDTRFSRQGKNAARRAGEIGIQSVRVGDVVGEHTIIFGGNGERLELSHKASSRDNFARGALISARWLAKAKPGLYDMQDVLGLNAC
jgi:4-hydroxy-tetrahydrodipicolinate reductase